jgi:23S rRNA (cytosine1962-C5)-methyltransferase
MISTVVVDPRSAERAERAHPWIYQSYLTEVRARGGDVVEVFAPRGRKLGEALYSDRSQMALRLLTRGEERFDAARLVAAPHRGRLREAE